MNIKKKISLIFVLLITGAVSVKAQVTIGSKKIPSPFSILELISGSESNNGNRGLRLPQLTFYERETLSDTYGDDPAMEGLQIYNTTTRCVETWNGSNWIQSCYDNTPDDIPSTPDDVELCLTTQDGLTYTYLAIAPPYVMPTSVKFYDDATLVGEDDTEPFEHTFDTPPSGEVTVVATYPLFDAGDPPSDQPTTGGIAYNMVGIPGGTFDMGGGEVGGIHRVNVSSFSIGETEVTQELWQAVWSSDDFTPGPTGSGNHDWWDNDYGLGDTYPAYYVSWYDAIAFCNKLSKQEGKKPVYVISGINNDNDDWSTFEYGDIPIDDNDVWNAVTIDLEAKGYRLPTEAEWEYAARGGEDYRYSGSDEIGDVAWYYGNSSDGSKVVGTQAYNNYGLHDMSGNLWEWNFDYFNNYPSCGRTLDPIQKTPNENYGSSRVSRGGSWINDAELSMVSFRYNIYSYYRGTDFGFRVVLVP